MTLVVETTAGRVAGTSVGGIGVFKGIPYAAPPFGEHRFAAPQPPQPWDGIRDATEFGATAPKTPYPAPIDRLLVEPDIAGDDILNLNVWTPAPGASLPVIVWIHGGAFAYGCSAADLYDGTHFARDGVVFVSMNYRLGAEGFALIDGAPANRGLLDQVAALEWVRDNIAAFGGNPDLVTIMGESAGGMSVVSLMAMPSARGLFRRAIAESGAGSNALAADTARIVSTELAGILGVDPTRGGFADVAPDDLVAAQNEVATRIRTQPDPDKWREITTHVMAFEPCIDGEVLPDLPLEKLADGASTNVDLLIGHNADEMTLFFVPSDADRAIDDGTLTAIAALHGLTDLAAYRSAYPDESPGRVLMRILRDWMYRIPALRVAEARAAHEAPTYVYRFEWRTPLYDGRLGATHALEVPFVFDNLHVPSSRNLTGPTPPTELAEHMHRVWVTFATTGSPGWAPYGESRTEMLFGDTCSTVDDDEADLRTVWDGVR